MYQLLSPVRIPSIWLKNNFQSMLTTPEGEIFCSRSGTTVVWDNTFHTPQCHRLLCRDDDDDDGYRFKAAPPPYTGLHRSSGRVERALPASVVSVVGVDFFGTDRQGETADVKLESFFDGVVCSLRTFGTVSLTRFPGFRFRSSAQTGKCN